MNAIAFRQNVAGQDEAVIINVGSFALVIGQDKPATINRVEADPELFRLFSDYRKAAEMLRAALEKRRCSAKD